MDTLRNFERDDFEEYRRWYDDPALDQALGPMDGEWLEAVLSEPPSAQQAFLVDGVLSAVIGLAAPTRPDEPWVITDLATRPDLRGQGIGRRAVAAVLASVASPGARWIAYVEDSNRAAQSFFASLGWTPGAEANEDGMWTYTAPHEKAGIEP